MGRGLTAVSNQEVTDVFSQGMFSIGGIASGLDTEDIITQLMKLERQPMVRIEQRQDQLRKVNDAWGQVNTKLSTLRTATDRINRLDRFDGMIKVSSSNTDAVSVARTGTTATGTQSFTVRQLATRQQQAGIDVFASRDAAIGDRTLSIDGHDITADLGEHATLQDLVAAINGADVGARASILQVGSGEFRLVLEARNSGLDGRFVVDAEGTTGWTSGFEETLAAQDAELMVGGITITRSSNIIDDLVDGATITLRKPTDAPVTVTAERDLDGAVKAVKDYVDALNGALSTIKNLTAYDPATGTAGPLQGQQAATRLAMSLRDAVAAPILGLHPGGSGSSLGIGLSRDGTITFDEARARQAFTDDFGAAARTLARSGATTDPAATYLNGASRTEPGTYEVVITDAAEVARAATGATYVPPDGDPKVFRISRPGREPVTVTVPADATAAAAVQAINTALRDAGVTTITASETDDGGLALAEERYGSAHGFMIEELDGDEVVAGGGEVFGFETGRLHLGRDVAGTIGGEAGAGSGRTLTAAGGPADGLSIQVTGSPAAFEVTYSRGLVGQVGTQLARAEGVGGIVARARAAIDSQIGIYQTRLDGFEGRLASREATLRRQFVGMESALHQLNSQGQWLTQQLSGLANLNRKP